MSYRSIILLNQIIDIYNKFLPNQSHNLEKFINFISKKKITIALLQKFLLDNYDCKNILDKIGELDSLIDFYENSSNNIYT